MKVTIPFPPSTNRMYRNYNGHMVMSDEARAYKAEAGWLAKAAAGRCISGPVVLTLRLYAPRRGRDADNCIKAVQDSLNGIAYDDDRQISELHVYREIDRKNPRVEVTVEECQRENIHAQGAGAQPQPTAVVIAGSAGGCTKTGGRTRGDTPLDTR